jgi:hypothetical protein
VWRKICVLQVELDTDNRLRSRLQERVLMVKRQTMRVLGAAIVLIVLSFAPSVVQAHTGHEHHAAAQAVVHGATAKPRLMKPNRGWPLHRRRAT